MNNNFKLGCNFDFDLLESIANINNISNKNKVTELYGSIRLHSEVAARPAFRLPDISEEDLEKYVKKAKKNGINFNYTMNSINPLGNKQNLVKDKESIIELVQKLENMGVYRITVANPIMLEIIRNEAHSDILLEISTIAHIDTITQIKFMYEKYGVTKICANLNKTRDFRWLEKAAEYCNKNGIILELMVNEFCGVGGGNYGTHCVYRDSCYIYHATNNTLEDANLFDNYPMGLCTKSRNENPSNWLKMKFIRPEDIKYYNSIGINNFKLTGRTGTSQYILRMLGSYLNESLDENLLSLWKPLESIGNDNKEDEHFYKIENKKLDGFIEHWVDGFNCDYEVCGETCNYCQNWYDNYVKE